MNFVEMGYKGMLATRKEEVRIKYSG
jgi:hypothetical protein